MFCVALSLVFLQYWGSADLVFVLLLVLTSGPGRGPWGWSRSPGLEKLIAQLDCSGSRSPAKSHRTAACVLPGS